MLWTYPQEYFHSQVEFYQYPLKTIPQLVPDAVPVDGQFLLSLIHSAAAPKSLRTCPSPHGLTAGQV